MTYSAPGGHRSSAGLPSAAGVADERPNIFTAFQEQSGLKLEPSSARQSARKATRATENPSRDDYRSGWQCARRSGGVGCLQEHSRPMDLRRETGA